MNVNGHTWWMVLLTATACAAPVDEQEPDVSESTSEIVNGTPATATTAEKLGIVKVANSNGSKECSGVLLDNMTVLTSDDCVPPGATAIVSQGSKQLPTFPSMRHRLSTGATDTRGNYVRLTALRLKYAAAVNGASSGFHRDTYAGSDATLAGTKLRCFGYGSRVMGQPQTSDVVQADLPVVETGSGYVRVGRGLGQEVLSRGDVGAGCFLGDRLVGIVASDVVECPGATCTHSTVTLASVKDARRPLQDFSSPQSIKTRSTGQCMTLGASGAPHAATCDAFNDAQWIYSSRFWLGDASYYAPGERLFSHRTGQAISVAAAPGGSASAPLTQSEESQGYVDEWLVKETPQPGYHAVHLPGDEQHCWEQSGTTYRVAPCTGAASQQFEFSVYPELSDARFHEGGGLCIDVPGAKQSDGAPVAHETCSNTSNQLWQVTREFSSTSWDTSLNLHPRHAAGKCLTVVGGSKASGATLEQRTCNGSPAQEFLMIRRGDDVRLKNRNSNLCVWRPWHFLGSHWSGDTLQQGDCNDAGSAAWTLL